MYYQRYCFDEFFLIMISDGIYLTGLYFDNENCLNDDYKEVHLDIFDETKKWLDHYFLGQKPTNELKLMINGTDFQKEVWNILLNIPYGTTSTYGDIANKIALNRGMKRMSAQSVGQAISKNPFAIIVPCHRVIGKNGHLIGYRWGIENKEKLLKLEGMIKEL